MTTRLIWLETVALAQPTKNKMKKFLVKLFTLILAISFCLPIFACDGDGCQKDGCSGCNDRYIEYDETGYSAGGRTIFDKVEDIEIDWITGKILVRVSDSPDVIISECLLADAPSKPVPLSVTNDLKSDDLMRVKFIDGVLYIKERKSGKATNPPEKMLIVNIPQTALYELKINSVSADVEISGATIYNINIHAVSANINATGNFYRFEGDTVSSKTTITSFTELNAIEANSVSGDYEIYIPSSSNFTVDTESITTKIEVLGFSDVNKNYKRIRVGTGINDYDFNGVGGNIKINAIN